jgi:predicted AlkP superfamily phosphohydrolase/phosphomutase
MDTLSRLGKRCIVMSVPFTYPPGKWYNGASVSDFLYPDVQVCPADLSPLLKGYRVVPDSAHKKGPDLADDMLAVTRRQIVLCKDLMSSVEWDLAYFYFGMIDSFFHSFYDRIGSDGPEWEAGKAILRCFDDLIGELMEGLGDDIFLLVISDHGFRLYPHTIYLNRVLESEGYLLRSYSYDKGRTRSSKGIGYRFARFLNLPVVHQVARSIYRIVGRIYKKAGNPMSVGLDEGLDYLNSAAYAPTTESLGIIVNDAAMRPPRSRRSLLEFLGSLEHDGEKVFTRIVPREELYKGPHVIRSPDYILFSEDFMLNANIFGKEHFGGVYPYHDMDAVFFLAGKGVKAGPMRERPDLHDIAPTVLHLLGTAPPEGMDGHVLDEAFLEVAKPSGPSEMDRIRRAALKLKGRGNQSR